MGDALAEIITDELRWLRMRGRRCERRKDGGADLRDADVGRLRAVRVRERQDGSFDYTTTRGGWERKELPDERRHRVAE